jgi:hypothetical protein
MNKRATTSGLLLTLAFLVVVYVLLLAPCEKCDLIGMGCNSCSNYGGEVILSESFGTLLPEAEDFTMHEFRNTNLFFKSSPEIRILANNLFLKNSLFGKKDQTLTFYLDDLDNIERSLLSFAVIGSQGIFKAKLNGHEIYANELTQGIKVLVLPIDYLQEENELKLSMSFSGISFWSKNTCELLDVSLKNEYEVVYSGDVSEFEVSFLEKETISSSSLSFASYCNVAEDVNVLKVYLNNENILFENLPCSPQSRVIEVEPSLLNAGINSLKFAIDGGDYLFSNIKLINRFDSPSFPSRYFNLDLFEDSIVYLDITSNEIGHLAEIYINNVKIDLESETNLFSLDITEYVFDGDNNLKIIPLNIFDMETLKITLI